MGLTVGAKFLRAKRVFTPDLQKTLVHGGTLTYPIDMMCDLRALGTAGTAELCRRAMNRIKFRQEQVLFFTEGCRRVRFVLAVDFEAGVPVEKAAERQKRAAASKMLPYDVTRFVRLEAGGIRFQDQDAPEELDLGRLMCTRSLRVHFYRFWRTWMEEAVLDWLTAPLWFDGGPGLVWRYDPKTQRVTREADKLSSQAGEGEVSAVVWGLRAQTHSPTVWVGSGDTDLMAIALMQAAHMTVPWVVNFAGRLYGHPRQVWRRWGAQAERHMVALLAMGTDYVDKKPTLHGVHTDCIWSEEEEEEGTTSASALPRQLRDMDSYDTWLRQVYTRELHRAKNAGPIIETMSAVQIRQKLMKRKAMKWPTADDRETGREQLVFNWQYWTTLHPQLVVEEEKVWPPQK